MRLLNRLGQAVQGLDLVVPADKVTGVGPKRPRRMSNDSASRCTRSDAATNGIPSASWSSRFQPAPSPISNRPPGVHVEIGQ